jgi:hypothetical protein
VSARRRRTRRHDPLASTGAVRRVLEQVALRISGSKLFNEKELIRALRAASHRERTGWRESTRGRRSRYDGAALRDVWRALDEELKRETGSAVSPRTFTEQYIRLLACPEDILSSLGKGHINLFEALQLARIKAKKGDFDEAGAARLRARVLEAHLAARGSARQLYERIDALLGTKIHGPRAGGGLAVRGGAFVERADGETEDVDEIDSLTEAYLAQPGALFADQLRQVTFALSHLEAADVSEADTTAILDLLDQLYLRATRAARRARER